MKKKQILALGVVVLCLAILASSTIAYFTDAAAARNVITSGAIDITVVEQQQTDGTLLPYPADPISMMPGDTVSKIVSVRSEENDAYIRVQISVTVLDDSGVPMELSDETLSSLVIVNTEDPWTLQVGWWYYPDAVGAGDETAPLLREVTFSGPDMDNAYQGCRVQIDILAQSVQAANNGDTALTAAGWPEE